MLNDMRKYKIGQMKIHKNLMLEDFPLFFVCLQSISISQIPWPAHFFHFQFSLCILCSILRRFQLSKSIQSECLINIYFIRVLSIKNDHLLAYGLFEGKNAVYLAAYRTKS